MFLSVRLVASAVAALVALVTAGSTHPAGPSTSYRDARSHRTAERVLHRMTLRQEVGQLFMVGTPATTASAAARAQITRRHVGNVILTGRSYGGTSVPARVSRALRARATAAATHGVDLLVATDQEGGLVQVLNGHGLSDMPTALRQGRWTLPHLRHRAGVWARQLRRAGVNMNLAPVEDTVPGPAAARRNPPIGGYDRELGYRPVVVARHGRALVTGMARHGVIPTLKHFPGLGRVHADTDTSSGVTDVVTRRHDPYLRPFAASVDAGAPVVMMSTAYYRHLDPTRPAAFSPFVIRRVLRGDLGFTGVVISDDLANARQVARWTPGARAVRFVAAGGDVVLSVNPATVPAMYRAVLSRAAHDARFRATVDHAALKVLTLKEHHGLL